MKRQNESTWRERKRSRERDTQQHTKGETGNILQNISLFSPCVKPGWCNSVRLVILALKKTENKERRIEFS